MIYFSTNYWLSSACIVRRKSYCRRHRTDNCPRGCAHAAGKQFVIRRLELTHAVVCIGFVRRCGRAPTHGTDITVQTRHDSRHGTLLIAEHVSYFSLELFAKKDATIFSGRYRQFRLLIAVCFEIKLRDNMKHSCHCHSDIIEAEIKHPADRLYGMFWIKSSWKNKILITNFPTNIFSFP